MALKELIAKLSADVQPILTSLKRVDTRLGTTSGRLNSLSSSFASMGAKMSLTLSAPIALLGRSAIMATADMQSLEATLSSVLGKFKEGEPTTKDIADEIDFLRKTANDLGVSFQAVQKPYVQYLASSNANLETTRKTVKGILGLSSAMGLTGAQTNLVIKALQQMSSKGRVAAEELRQQLGDNVPGAVQLFAAANKMTVKQFSEMMERGEITDRVLDNLAETIEKKYSKAIEKSSQSLRANMNRISNAFFDFRLNIGRAIEESFNLNKIFKKVAVFLKDVGKGFRNLNKEGKKKILIFTGIVAIGGPLLGFLALLAAGAGGAITAVRGLAKGFIFLSKAMRAATLTALRNPWIALGTAVAGVATFVLLTSESKMKTLKKIYEDGLGALKDMSKEELKDLEKDLEGPAFLNPAVWAEIGNRLKPVIDDLKFAFFAASDTMDAWFEGGLKKVNLFWDIMKAMIDWVKGIGGRIADAFSGISFSGILDGIMEPFNKMPDWVKTLIGFTPVGGALEVTDALHKKFGSKNIDVNMSAKQNMAPNVSTSNKPANNSTNNNLIINIPAGMSALDSAALKDAVKAGVREESKRSYFELAL